MQIVLLAEYFKVFLHTDYQLHLQLLQLDLELLAHLFMLTLQLCFLLICVLEHQPIDTSFLLYL